MHGHQLGAVGKRALDLHVVDHSGHAGHDLVTAEKLPPEIHQLRDAAPIADELQQLRGDERDGLGMVQPPPAREALLREKSSLMQRELVEFARRKVHGIYDL